MHFFVLILLFCFFILLFCIYALSHDDIVFLKKDVSLEKIFNLSLSGAIVGIFFARFFYGIFYSKTIFENPLKFFLFPYFPGLSLAGAVVGGTLFLSLLFKKKNLPGDRLFDFFSIAFLSTLPIGYLGYFLLSGVKIFTLEPLLLIIIYSLLFIFFALFLLPCLMKRRVEDGTVGFLFLVCFSITSLIKIYIEKKVIFWNVEDFILLLVLLISLIFIVDKENLIEKVKKLKK